MINTLLVIARLTKLAEAISTGSCMGRQYYVYILTNKNNRVLYTGMTNDLRKRVWQHKEKFVPGFTTKYNVSKLVYYEILEDPENAVLR